MEIVSFIAVETGDDLILSFAVQCPDEPSEIESLILMRTPKYELFFEDHERGVKVSFEREKADDRDLLQKIDYVEAEAIVRIQTSSRKYELDVRKVDGDALARMRDLLRNMNFDRKFRTSGI